ncbi:MULTISPECIES: hypothetical protein [Streptomyces]|jgi:hypothetical protein|uniref:Uncharacterized protein n=2 Tax=Streptomyces TaxID=1883 RepID=A0A514JK24_9ACTN|nr:MULTISPECIES: hypothetical protein [Streptomyces]MBA8941746.1 hypothetical protein [Streptomyces calvus]MBA8976321.1 hypothetical protein [Streptomyces calvus]MYS26234.1 hypothetical protein [Streptomyces sp. SID7804]QDI67677.1 hypothetical protein CD934_02605 [Streptomyces calvus]GGP62050.1 hypothetical protein GCM10010247_38460 [Streptomyces calvus]
MATQTFSYFFVQNLPPGYRGEITWGPDPFFDRGTFTVSAHPVTNLRQTLYWLTFDDVSVGKKDIGSGDISNVQSYLWAKTRNSGLSGQGTVKSHTVYLTRTTA